MTVDFINMINNIAAGGKTELNANFRPSFRNVIAF